MLSWIQIGAWCSVVTGLACASWIAIDTFRHPQHMRVMNVVWPITSLYSGPLGIWAYLKLSRATAATKEVTWREVTKGTLHCGAGCTLGDLASETILLLAPGVLVALGWHTLWSERIYSAWILDFVLAFSVGIVFQYFAIAPMNPGMHPGQALRKALQADTLSLTFWQIGMYAVMALAHFWLFPQVLHAPLREGSVTFWWVMQWAMLTGFVTAYPVNRWLIANGIKEKM